MTGLVALTGFALIVVAFLAVGILVGALLIVALLVAFVAACVAVGVVIGDSVGAIGSGRRRAPVVPYWSVR